MKRTSVMLMLFLALVAGFTLPASSAEKVDKSLEAAAEKMPSSRVPRWCSMKYRGLLVHSEFSSITLLNGRATQKMENCRVAASRHVRSGAGSEATKSRLPTAPS